MWIDPIVEETRSIRDSIAARFGYDVLALGEYFKSHEKVTVISSLNRPMPLQKRLAEL